jgi:GNAT superfamily N-acetyltransferase
MNAIAKILEALGVTYEIYRIYVQDGFLPPCSPPGNVFFKRTDGAELSLATDPQVRALRSYDRSAEAFGFGAVIEGQIQCACWYWVGKTYLQRGFWHLQPNEAKLVEIATAEQYRGRGLATALIEWSSGEMAQKGFVRRFARIWHSNKSSIRAFAKAGWRPYAFVVTVSLKVSKSSLRFEKIAGKRMTVAAKKST